MLINPERKNSLLGLELVVVFVGLLAHSFATIANFQWFSKLPSPLNGMVEGNHWDQWFSDGFGVRQPLVTMVFDGCAPLVRRWNGYVPSLKSIAQLGGRGRCNLGKVRRKHEVFLILDTHTHSTLLPFCMVNGQCSEKVERGLSKG